MRAVVKTVVKAVVQGRRWTVPALLLLLAAVPSVAGVARLAALAAGRVSPESLRFADAPVPIVLHLLAVIPYALLGALQFVPGLRRGRWHRTAGRLLVPSGLLAAVTGVWMTLSYPWPANDGVAVYLMRLVVGAAMLGAIVMGVVALRHRDFARHGAWMLRGYALGMGAGTQVLTHLPWFIVVGGTPGETPRAVMMGLGWLINAVVAEYVVARAAAPVRRPAVQASVGPLIGRPVG